MAHLLRTVFIMLSCYIIITKGEMIAGCKQCACHHDNRFGGVLVQCSKRRLQQVPPFLPGRTTTLLLDNNNFINLTGRAFVSLKNLKRLDISRNGLQTLTETAFVGLSELVELNLEWNHLVLNDSTFSRFLFKPLIRLKSLKLNRNTNPMYLPTDASYPDSSFQYLVSLQELFLDGLPGAFGPGFRKLIHLKNLTLSGSNGYCTVPMFQNSTFENVPYVEMLNVSNCLTSDVELMTFLPLNKITTLDASMNHRLGFANFSKALYGLQTSPIRILKLNSVYPFYGTCTHIRINHFLYLKNTTLKELHIDGNGIIGAEEGAFTEFPSSLEVISARENRFAFGIYLFELPYLKSLRFLDITYLNAWRTSLDRPVHSPLPNSVRALFPILFPPNLETFVLSKCYISGIISSNAKTQSMRNFIADHNLLSSIKSPLYAFERVEYVDLSHNILSNIDKSIFSNYSLKYVDLSHNDLGDCFKKDEQGEIFQGLANLIHLNISANKISFLSRDMFKDHYLIETLCIADNELDYFNVSLRHMNHLKNLDLGNNKLQSLNANVLHGIDRLENVTLRLRGNSLSCSCPNIEFLKWMSKNRIKIRDLQTTQCVLNNGRHANLTDLEMIVNDLIGQCGSYVVILVSTLSVLILIMIVMCLAIAYRYRWKLRRVYYLGNRRRHQEVDEDPAIYTYDAFVSYADADRGFVKNCMIPELEQKVGLRLCVHDRDFIPGTVIASNIANAIQNSHKTLILLSPSFLKSDWCQFEYNMARAEGVSRRENVVVAVLYRPVHLNDMPRDMGLLFTQYSYLQYDENGHDEEIFWQNITDAIRTPGPTDA